MDVERLKSFHRTALDRPWRCVAIVGMLALATVLSPTPWIHVPVGVLGFCLGAYVRSRTKETER